MDKDVSTNYQFMDNFTFNRFGWFSVTILCKSWAASTQAELIVYLNNCYSRFYGDYLTSNTG